MRAVKLRGGEEKGDLLLGPRLGVLVLLISLPRTNSTPAIAAAPAAAGVLAYIHEAMSLLLIPVLVLVVEVKLCQCSGAEMTPAREVETSPPGPFLTWSLS